MYSFRAPPPKNPKENVLIIIAVSYYIVYRLCRRYI